MWKCLLLFLSLVQERRLSNFPLTFGDSRYSEAMRERPVPHFLVHLYDFYGNVRIRSDINSIIKDKKLKHLKLLD